MKQENQFDYSIKKLLQEQVLREQLFLTSKLGKYAHEGHEDFSNAAIQIDGYIVEEGYKKPFFTMFHHEYTEPIEGFLENLCFQNIKFEAIFYTKSEHGIPNGTGLLVLANSKDLLINGYKLFFSIMFFGVSIKKQRELLNDYEVVDRIDYSQYGGKPLNFTRQYITHLIRLGDKKEKYTNKPKNISFNSTF